MTSRAGLLLAAGMAAGPTMGAALAGDGVNKDKIVFGQAAALEGPARLAKTVSSTIGRLDSIANDVAAAVEQQGVVTQNIAYNAGAAAQGTQQVAKNITQVSQVASETDRVANTVLHAAGELSARSGSLRSEVERFLAQVRAA